MAQFCEWFDLDHITPSAAQFNTEKLNWLNHEYIKQMHRDTLGALLRPFLVKAGLDPEAGPNVARVAELLRERAPTLVEMAAQAHYFYARPHVDAGLLAQHLSDAAKPAVIALAEKFGHAGWTRAEISAAIKAEVVQFGLKMPQLMMPLRVLLTGQTQTPGLDAVIEVLGREEVVARLGRTNLLAA